MNILKCFIMLSCLSITASGCATQSIQVDSTDPKTGTHITKNFTKYFEGESTLVDNKVELFSVAQISWKKVPPEQQNPKDQEQLVYVDIKTHIHNVTAQRFDFQITSIHLLRDSKEQYLQNEPLVFTLIPDTVERYVENDYIIGSMDQEIIQLISYTWNGKKAQVRVRLKRLTKEDLKERGKGPGVY